ncbi:MAG: hypothetical protein ACUVYA_20215 [Planctomycetota bacterium]
MARDSSGAGRFAAAAAVLYGAAAFLVTSRSAVEAFSCRLRLVPNGEVYRCATCHVSEGGGGPRNPFGEAVDRFGVGCEEFWEPELALLDSDGDGRTNGEELGDREGTWRPGASDPGDPALVTNPGVPDPPRIRAFIRGDANADGVLTVADAIATLRSLFLGGEWPGCLGSADANGDEGVDIADAVFSLLFLFGGGAAPPAPFPDCGVPPRGAACAAFGPCA